jgi:hypothetical protein
MNANGANGVFASLPELVVPDRHIIPADFDDEHLSTDRRCSIGPCYRYSRAVPADHGSFPWGQPGSDRRSDSLGGLAHDWGAVMSPFLPALLQARGLERP